MARGPGGRGVHQDWDVKTAHVLLVALAALPGPLLRVPGHPGGQGGQSKVTGLARSYLARGGERQSR